MSHDSILYQQYSNQTTNSYPNSEPVSPLQALADPRFRNLFVRAEDYRTQISVQQIIPKNLNHSPSNVTFTSKPWSPSELPIEKATSTPKKSWLSPSWKSRLQGLLIGLAVAAIGTGTTLGVLLTRPTTNSTPSAETSVECDSLNWNTMPEIVAGNGTFGSNSYTLNYPQSIFVTPDNALYVADYNNHRVQKFVPDSLLGITVAGVTGSPGSSPGFIRYPMAIYVNSQNKLYVSDSFGISVWMLGTSNNSRVSGINTAWIYALYVDNDGNIYFSDGSCAIRLWTPTSSSVTTVIGGNGCGYSSNQLNYIPSFTIDSSTNTIYVANSNAHTIVAWPIGAIEGTIVFGKNQTSGFNNYLLNYPQDVKQDQYRNFYVWDGYSTRIMLFCENSANTGGRVIVSYQLDSATSIALDSDLNLYVARSYPYQVQRYDRIK